MIWPDVSDYCDALQAPGTAFTDTALKSAVPVLDRLGRPALVVGATAAICRAQSNGHEIVIRLFLRAPGDILERYEKIAAHVTSDPLRLGSVAIPRGLRNEIRILGKAFPVAVMPYVEGASLEKALETRLGDRSALLGLAESLRSAFVLLREGRFAHGDLEPGNILVTDSGIRFVDVDGSWVPALQNSPSDETGNPAFQHPRRTKAHWGEAMDDFAALGIVTAVAALAEKPELWTTSHREGENLIFLPEDLANPGGTELWSKLVSISDQRAGEYVQAFLEGCKFGPDRIRTLNALPPLGGSVPSPVSAQAAAGTAPAPAAAAVPIGAIGAWPALGSVPPASVRPPLSQPAPPSVAVWSLPDPAALRPVSGPVGIQKAADWTLPEPLAAIAPGLTPTAGPAGPVTAGATPADRGSRSAGASVETRPSVAAAASSTGETVATVAYSVTVQLQPHAESEETDLRLSVAEALADFEPTPVSLLVLQGPAESRRCLAIRFVLRAAAEVRAEIEAAGVVRRLCTALRNRPYAVLAGITRIPQVESYRVEAAVPAAPSVAAGS